MPKIIKLTNEEIIIAKEDNSVVRVPKKEIDFVPSVGDVVELFSDGDSYIVTKTDKKKDSIEDKININIVNENNNHQKQVMNNYGDKNGKRVNKIAYIVIALLLGGIGGHKFYSGFTSKGFMYLVFSWTAIPFFLAIASAISASFKKPDENGNILITS